MTKSNVAVVQDGSSGRGYYCAGSKCAIKEKCHRHTSGVAQLNAVFDDYDILMLTEESCKFFVNVKEVNQLGLDT